MRTLARAHPIAAWLAVTLGWSWGAWSLLFLFIRPGGIVHDPPPAAVGLAALGALGPTVGTLVVTPLVEGRAGLRALGRRLGRARVGRWWLALLLIPALTAAVLGLRALAGEPIDTAAMLRRLGPALGLALFAGLTEEPGWRGFLLPRLLERWSPWRATLLVGLVWGGLWHGYADFFAFGDRGAEGALLILLLGPALLTAWSLVLTRVHQGTRGSLLLAVLTHGTISGPALLFGQPYPDAATELRWTLVAVALAWAGALALWRFTARPLV